MGNPIKGSVAITSLTGFIEAIESIDAHADVKRRTTGLWFRGIGEKYSKALVPSLYRKANLSQYEREMARDFRLRYRGYGIADRSYIERMSMMQHYGLPTRLLDWTENALCALYFACDGKADKDGVVYVLDPWAFNHHFNPDVISVPTGDSDALKAYELIEDIVQNPLRTVSSEFPLAFRPNMTNDRIQAQRGLFTIHGRSKTPIEVLTKRMRTVEVLWQLAISSKDKTDIRRQLAVTGVTSSTLFPGIQGLCEEICEHYGRLA